MPQNPTRGEVHVSTALTNVSVAYEQKQDAFIAGRFFGTVPVTKEAGIYWEFNQDDWMRDEAKMRAPGSPPAYAGFETTQNTYACKRYDLAKVIPDDIAKESDHNLDQITTRWLQQQLLIRRERLFSVNHFATGKWTSEATPSTLWDVDTSEPFVDVDTGRKTILTGCGQEPNKMAVGYDVHQAIKKHPLIIERVKYVAGSSFQLAVAPRNVAAQILAEAFELDEYLVARSVYTASVEGDTTPTYEMIQGKHALLGYCNPEPSLMTPSAGYIFRDKTFGGNDSGIRVKKWYNDELEGNVIENAFKEDMKQVCDLAGYFFLSAVS